MEFNTCAGIAAFVFSGIAYLKRRSIIKEVSKTHE